MATLQNFIDREWWTCQRDRPWQREMDTSCSAMFNLEASNLTARIGLCWPVVFLNICQCFFVCFCVGNLFRPLLHWCR